MPAISTSSVAAAAIWSRSRGMTGSGCRSTPNAWTAESSSGPRRWPARCRSQRHRWLICSLCSRNGTVQKCMAKRLLTRAFNADQSGRMIVLSLGSDPGAGQRCSPVVGKIAEPVTEEWCRRGCSVFMPEGAVRQISAQCRPSFDARASLEACKPILSLDVEIAGRHARIAVALAGKVSGDVAQIFPLQRQSVIFGMALEEDEVALQLPGEDIDAGFRRRRQELVAAGRQARSHAAR